MAAAPQSATGEQQGEPVCIEVTKGRRRVYRRCPPAAVTEQQREHRAGSCTLAPPPSASQLRRPKTLEETDARLRVAQGDGSWEIVEDRMTHQRWLGNALQDFLLPQVRFLRQNAAKCSRVGRPRGGVAIFTVAASRPPQLCAAAPGCPAASHSTLPRRAFQRAWRPSMPLT